MDQRPQWSRRGTTLGLLFIGELLAGGCATHSLYVRPGMNTPCSTCDPAKENVSELLYRVILIGDAGAPVTGTEAVARDVNFEMTRAATIPGKSMIVFLGDNIYPAGLPPVGSPRTQEEGLLDRQLDLVPQGVKAVVIPGNHDWDKSGPNGQARIQAQGDYVDQKLRNDDRIQFQPKRGCPGPVYMDVGEGTPQVRLVFFDSEWLLRTGANRTKRTTVCMWGPVGALERYSLDGSDSINEKHFAEKLKAVLPGDRHLILFAHHPIRTAGAHGGKYPWWQYAVSLSLYPVIRYRLVRSPQDLTSPRNVQMRNLVTSALPAVGDRSVVHVSGHEHGLQAFDSPNALYLVSGSGSKTEAIGKASDTAFKLGELGLMTVDYMSGNRTLLRVLEAGRSEPVLFHWMKP